MQYEDLMDSVLVKDYKYISISALPMKPGRKTLDFVLMNKSQALPLGIIKWYGAWRQFCFYPDAGTVWSISCLMEVNGFLRELKNERARKKNHG